MAAMKTVSGDCPPMLFFIDVAIVMGEYWV